MFTKTSLTALRLPHKRARLQLLGDLKPYLRLHFLHSAYETGILPLLKAAPASSADLAGRLGVKRPELLDTLLTLGVALKEISLRDGRYRLSGARSKALVSRDGDALAAVIQELTTYHASVYGDLCATLKSGERGDYLETTGKLIARSSRVLEPFVEEFVKTVVKNDGPMRMLEVGCGSGVYLRHAAARNRGVTGVAVDLREEVVRGAAANLEAWGMAGRFKLIAADIRKPPADLSGPFDLITLYNNIYYFEPEERPALFRRFRDWLAPDGALALVSMMRGGTLTALDFDLALRATNGVTPLPEVPALTAQLRDAGFSRVESTQLVPLEPVFGIVAT